MLTRPVMSRDELTALIDEGVIDSVIMGFVDRYGRLVGKRASVLDRRTLAVTPALL